MTKVEFINDDSSQRETRGQPVAVASEETPPGQPGSLENPEVYENVPGHVIPILAREFDDFDSEAQKFLSGERKEADFVGFRLRQGVYGQRQADVQMVRVKLPFGGITPEQMDAFAEVAEQDAPLHKGHITTRQNVQFHHIPLLEAAQVIRRLGAAGLSTREACGNTVRNVAGDPYAGVCEGELFDPTPYIGAFVRYFIRNELTQLLPRKFKVAFASTDQDVVVTGIHDLGFLPRIRNGEKGFRMRTGGGTSILARIGYTLRFRAAARVPKSVGSGAAHFQSPRRAAGQSRPRPAQIFDRPHRHRRVPALGRPGVAGPLGERARLRS